MRIGLAQMDMVWEEKEKNFEKSRRFLDEAESKKVELVVFPEMSMTGFSMHPEAMGEEGEQGETLGFFREEAKKRGIWIGVGYIKKGAPKARNCFGLINPKGELAAEYAKLHPFSYGREAEFYEGGESLVLCPVQEFVAAPLICYDLRFPEVFQILSAQAQLILVPANWPRERQEDFTLLLRARALENQCYVAGINRTGQGGGLCYGGGSLVANPQGKVTAMGGEGEELVTADLDLDSVLQYRRDFPVKKDRRDGLYMILSKKSN